MALLYLVRHGTSVEQDMVRGRLPGFPLNEKGKREAALAADFLADRDITAVYSSPLQRAYETAQYIAREKKLNIKMSEQLSEWYTPAWQGKHWNEISKLQLIHYVLRPATLNLGGEMLGEVAERTVNFCKSAALKTGNVVCVSHEGPILACKLKLLGKSLNWLRFESCKTGSVTVIDVTEEGARQLEYFEP